MTKEIGTFICKSIHVEIYWKLQFCILLKVALNTINQAKPTNYKMVIYFYQFTLKLEHKYLHVWNVFVTTCDICVEFQSQS
jgi:hypothetical protein